jgi:hypothetical protein
MMNLVGQLMLTQCIPSGTRGLRRSRKQIVNYGGQCFVHHRFHGHMRHALKYHDQVLQLEKGPTLP